MIDLTNPKIALVHGALMTVLGNRDVEKIPNYFTEDAILIINEVKLQGREIYNRIQWLKDNTSIQSILVQVHDVFFDGEQGFDHHTSEIVYVDNSRVCYKIFGYIKLRNQKICHYEDVTIQLEGKRDMTVVTSATTT